MRRRAWRAAAASTLALVGGLVVTIGSQAPAGAAGITSPGSVLVEGAVLSHGRPVAGAQVSLYEWPDSSVLSGLRPGEAVPWRTVASAVTGASGAYALSVAPSALLPLAAPDGMANLELMALSATGQASFEFPRQVAVARDGRAAVAPVGGQTATLADLQLRPRGGASLPRSGIGCYNVFRKSLGDHWDVVGQTYSVTTGVDHTFVYQYGASSSLGAGFSATDLQGSWSEDGTASQSSTAQTQYPTYGDGQGVYYETAFTYGLFEYEGLCGGWDANPTGYAGGAQTSVSNRAPGTLKANCRHYIADTIFTKTTTAAVEWTDGLDIAAVLGIDLSTQTGYSSTAALKFTFHAGRDLCGTNGPPGGSPGQLVARSYLPGT